MEQLKSIEPENIEFTKEAETNHTVPDDIKNLTTEINQRHLDPNTYRDQSELDKLKQLEAKLNNRVGGDAFENLVGRKYKNN